MPHVLAFDLGCINYMCPIIRTLAIYGLMFITCLSIDSCFAVKTILCRYLSLHIIVWLYFLCYFNVSICGFAEMRLFSDVARLEEK